MSVALLTSFMLMTVLSPVVDGDCTVVVNGASEPGTKKDPRPLAGGCGVHQVGEDGVSSGGHPGLCRQSGRD